MKTLKQFILATFLILFSNLVVAAICPTGPVTSGIDVSDYQSNAVWSKVHSSGRAFIFIKATQGISFTAKNFSTNWQNAKAEGLIRSAYHFFMPEDNPTQQANFFLLTMRNLEPNDLAPMLDWEFTNHVPKKTIIANAKIWLQTIENATGRVPIIYTNPEYWKALGNPPGFERYPLFVADYQTNCPDVPAPWKTWTFWQHAVGAVPGIQTRVDMDVFNGGLTELVSLSEL